MTLPGLEVWVRSMPAGTAHVGGDVHYLSNCPQCIVSRIALADVSGHGDEVAAFAGALRTLMIKYLSALDQVALMRDLNQVARLALGSFHYASMMALGWHSRRGLLVVTNAGHPPPMLYRASTGRWSWLDADHRSKAPAGVPLGLLQDVQYFRQVIRLEAGDLVVLYSDGASEAVNDAGAELGRDGLMALAVESPVQSVKDFGLALAQSLVSFRGSSVALDDETVIVLRAL
ncbi:MAG TPA: PP2C family protein-serine/threonine phosphatase [Vicinamibacterales bacterium]